jgi:polyphosphate glucokinase
MRQAPVNTELGFLIKEALASGSSGKNVLVVDVGGTSVKILASGQTEVRSFPFGPTLTATRMVSGVKKIAADWNYEVVSIDYPGPVLEGRPTAEPANLGRGWIGFDFAAAFGRPVKVVNDATGAGYGQLQRRQNAVSWPGNGPR